MQPILAAMLFSTLSAAGCNEELFTVTEWSIEERDPFPPLNVTLRYEGDRPIRMVDGHYWLADVLGARTGGGPIPRDSRLSPGDTLSTVAFQGTDDGKRLLQINPADVITSTCVRGLVYEDGTVERFE
jgi:hypothetical protein